ncbi:hypothetical protein [Aureliella helgolandensis]|uniref:Uncharacterized protein n=1 Tax=Aureliella helgolandensis TaxID=2527968 RepID=A0A518G2N3_9BACT|nr:hypothetical protein [Aureliella helgolandensis]QDV22866.1 hypothetical protein Q31a_11590 [Aureliella helgolandensis]
MDNDTLKDDDVKEEKIIRIGLLVASAIGFLVVLVVGAEAIRTGNISAKQAVELAGDARAQTPAEPDSVPTWEESGLSPEHAELLNKAALTPGEKRRLSIMQAHHKHNYAKSVTTSSTYNDLPVTAVWTFDPLGKFQMAVFKVNADIELRDRGSAIAGLLMKDCPGYMRSSWFSDEISKGIETQLPQRWVDEQGYRMSVMVSSPLDITVRIDAETN